ncbi:MAG: ABC transporter permease [Chloroflexaceae bacterium]|jgi:ABC-2 type transport system permease protein|nr:ABC transporter permease [Chloroflexaceae bacterium]
MRRFFFLARSVLVMMLRDQASFIGTLLIPIVLLLVLGAVNTDARVGAISIAAWLTVGVLVQGMLAGAVDGDMAWLTMTRDRGILWRVRASPLPPATLLLAYTSARLVLVLLKALLIVGTGMLVFGVRLEWSGVLPALGLVLLGGAVFLALGQAVAAAAPSASAASVIANLIFFPLIFTSNLFIAGLPAWVENITRWNPAYMLVDLLRPALLGMEASQAAWINLTGLLLYGVAGIILAVTFFQWEPKR